MRMRKYKRLVQFSGGAGSFEAARRTFAKFGENDVGLVFADTLIESPGLYRFLIMACNLLMPGRRSAEVARLISMIDALPPLPRRSNPDFDLIMSIRAQALLEIAAGAMALWHNLAWIGDGRTPWQVFRDERFIGNSRVDPCSKILKRQICDRWRRENNPDAVIVLGLDWTETHRIKSAASRFEKMGIEVEFPLNYEPWFSKKKVIAELESIGIPRSMLYRLGFSHDNCGGFCVKAGQGHFKLLLDTLPEVYAHHEDEEQFTMAFIGRDDIGVMTDRRGGVRVPMTLRQFRERIEAAQMTPDMFDIGGCGCFSPVEE